jgi:excisionase family DNA binding protein
MIDTLPEFDPLASPLMTAEELSKLLQVSERTVWRLNSGHEIPKPVRFGGTVRWRREEIAEWIKAGCPPLTSRENGSRRK